MYNPSAANKMKQKPKPVDAYLYLWSLQFSALSPNNLVGANIAEDSVCSVLSSQFANRRCMLRFSKFRYIFVILSYLRPTFLTYILNWSTTCYKLQGVRTALFWDVTQRLVVINFGLFGTNYRSLLQGSRNLFSGLRNQDSWILKMELIGCPEA